jgi:hypothetical protein
MRQCNLQFFYQAHFKIINKRSTYETAEFLEFTAKCTIFSLAKTSIFESELCLKTNSIRWKHTATVQKCDNYATPCSFETLWWQDIWTLYLWAHLTNIAAVPVWAPKFLSCVLFRNYHESNNTVQYCVLPNQKKKFSQQDACITALLSG